MVKRVKRLPPELDPSAFAEEWELPVLHESKVRDIPPWTCECVATHVAEHPGLTVSQKLRFQRLGHDAGIEPLYTRPEGRIVVRALVDLKWADGVALHTCGGTRSKTVDAAIDVDRLAGKESGDTTDLPAAQHPTDKGITRLIKERQVVNVAGIEHLRPVEVRGGVPAGQE